MKKHLHHIIILLPSVLQARVFAITEWLMQKRAQFHGWLESRSYQHSGIIKDYCEYNKKHIASTECEPSGLILTDCFPVPQWVIANSIFLNALAKKFNSSIASYGFHTRANKVNEIYCSFGAKQHLQVRLNKEQRKQRNELYISSLATIKSPDDLFNLRLENVWIGLDIYESTLRVGLPTVTLDSYHARFNLFHGLGYFIYFRDLISSGKIKAVALSHDCYLQIGLVAKIASKFNIPVFYANPFEIVKSIKTHDICTRFRYYPEYFATCSIDEQKTALEFAKKALHSRLGGVVGVDMSYQVKSAFTGNSVPRQTSRTEKLKVLVATHCFYDNPHAYSRMTFRDFYQWLEFLGQISLETDYEWYIKPHRDYLPGTMEILEEFASKYKKFKVINPETSFHQLKAEGASIALTCYGSIGHELPLLGFRVINASYNPHYAYGFNIHCDSVEEYADVLKNLCNLPPADEIEKIYEFYAVHHYLTRSNTLLFESFADYSEHIEGDPMSDKGYEFFMKDPAKVVERYRENVDAFLASDCHYDFELRLKNWHVEPYRIHPI